MDSPPGRSSSRDALLSLDTSFPELPLLRKPDLPSAHEAHEPVHKFESFSQTDIDNMVRRAWEIKRLHCRDRPIDHHTFHGQNDVPVKPQPPQTEGDSEQLIQTVKTEDSIPLIFSLRGNPKFLNENHEIGHPDIKIDARHDPLLTIKKETTSHSLELLSPSDDNSGPSANDHKPCCTTSAGNHTHIPAGSATWDLKIPHFLRNEPLNQDTYTVDSDVVDALSFWLQTFVDSYAFWRQHFAVHCSCSPHPRCVLSPTLGRSFKQLLYQLYESDPFERQPSGDGRSEVPDKQEMTVSRGFPKVFRGLPGRRTSHISIRDLAFNPAGFDWAPDPASFQSGNDTNEMGHIPGGQSFAQPINFPNHPLANSQLSIYQRHLRFLHEAAILGYRVSGVQHSDIAVAAEDQFIRPYAFTPTIPIPLPQESGYHGFHLPSRQEYTSTASIQPQPINSTRYPDAYEMATRNSQFDGANPTALPTIPEMPPTLARLGIPLETEANNFAYSSGSGPSPGNVSLEPPFSVSQFSSARMTVAESPDQTETMGAGSTGRVTSSRHACSICNKTFRRSSLLEDHKHVHTGTKPGPVSQGTNVQIAANLLLIRAI